VHRAHVAYALPPPVLFVFLFVFYPFLTIAAHRELVDGVAASQNTLPSIHVTFISSQREYHVRLLRITVNHDLGIEVDRLVDVGATLEPLAVAWYGVKKSSFKKDQTALITGAGPVCHPQHHLPRQGQVLTTIFILDRIVSSQSFTVCFIPCLFEECAYRYLRGCYM
jgi:hypothetical protein